MFVDCVYVGETTQTVNLRDHTYTAPPELVGQAVWYYVVQVGDAEFDVRSVGDRSCKDGTYPWSGGRRSLLWYGVGKMLENGFDVRTAARELSRKNPTSERLVFESRGFWWALEVTTSEDEQGMVARVKFRPPGSLYLPRTKWVAKNIPFFWKHKTAEGNARTFCGVNAVLKSSP